MWARIDGRFQFPVEAYLLARGDAYAATYVPEAFVCLSESIDLHQVDPTRIRVPITLVAVIEDQLIRILYNMDASKRPSVVGKRDESGAVLLPSEGELTPTMVAAAVVARLRKLGHRSPALEQRLAKLEAFDRPADGFPRPRRTHTEAVTYSQPVMHDAGVAGT